MPKGLPPDIVTHLFDVHSGNSTLDKVLDSAIGDAMEGQLRTAEMSGYTPAYGFELWGYETGTTVSLLADINSGPESSYAGVYGGFTEFNGDLYFIAYDPTYGNEPRRLSGTDGSLSLVADINTGSATSMGGVSDPRVFQGFVEFNGDLYFRAYDEIHGGELRKLSGSDGSVSLVADISTGSQFGFPRSSNPGLYGGFVEFNGDLYFTAVDETYGAELRKLSGTDGSVSLVADIWSGPRGSVPGFFGGFIEFNGDLYFTASDEAYGSELRKLSGTDGSVSLVADINTGLGSPSIFSPPGSSSPGIVGGFIEFNGDLYFTAYDDTYGAELRKLSGTDGSVSLVADFYGGAGNSSPGAYGGFVEFNGDLYFTAFDPNNGIPLRRLDDSDGTISTVAGTGSWPSVTPGYFGGFTEFSGDLYFTARDPVSNDLELRKLDGAKGTVETFDFAVGDSLAQVLGVVNGNLVVGAFYDRDGDGPAGPSWTMLASAGEPTRLSDFHVVDDGSGLFEPGGAFYVSDSFFLV